MPLLDPSTPNHSQPSDDNRTQPLPPDFDAPTRSFWSRLRSAGQWPRPTQLGLAATGGALAVAAVSMAVGVLVGSAPAPRQFFGDAEMTSHPNAPLRIANHPAPAAAPVPEADAAPEGAIYQPASTNPDERLNRDGTGLAAIEPLSDEDQRRLERRREEDRIARETRALEDKKRLIEREIERKQLEEKQQQENQQMLEAREAEDKKRLEDRLAEDRRLLDERRQAEKQSVEEQQRALDDQARKLAEANP